MLAHGRVVVEADHRRVPAGGGHEVEVRERERVGQAAVPAQQRELGFAPCDELGVLVAHLRRSGLPHTLLHRDRRSLEAEVLAAFHRQRQDVEVEGVHPAVGGGEDELVGVLEPLHNGGELDKGASDAQALTSGFGERQLRGGRDDNEGLGPIRAISGARDGLRSVWVVGRRRTTEVQGRQRGRSCGGIVARARRGQRN